MSKECQNIPVKGEENQNTTVESEKNQDVPVKKVKRGRHPKEKINKVTQLNSSINNELRRGGKICNLMSINDKTVVTVKNAEKVKIKTNTKGKADNKADNTEEKKSAVKTVISIYYGDLEDDNPENTKRVIDQVGAVYINNHDRDAKGKSLESINVPDKLPEKKVFAHNLKYHYMKLTHFDQRVYNCVCTLYKNNRKEFTVDDVYYLMCGYKKATPAKYQLTKVAESIFKMSHTVVSANITNEVLAKLLSIEPDKRNKIDKRRIENLSDGKLSILHTSLLSTKMIFEIDKAGELLYSQVSLLDIPVFLEYCEAKGELFGNIPVEAYGVPVSLTDKNIAFVDYLIMRVMNFKNKVFNQNSVKIETLYKECGQDMPRSDHMYRDIEVLNQILSSWENIGFIMDYKIDKTRIVFDTDAVFA